MRRAQNGVDGYFFKMEGVMQKQLWLLEVPEKRQTAEAWVWFKDGWQLFVRRAGGVAVVYAGIDFVAYGGAVGF